MWKNKIKRKSVEVQPWTPLEIILNEFCLWITVRCMQVRVSWCCHIEFGSTCLLWLFYNFLGSRTALFAPWLLSSLIIVVMALEEFFLCWLSLGTKDSTISRIILPFHNSCRCVKRYYKTGGAGKARLNVATPTNATVTCTAYVLPIPYNFQTKSI